MKRVILFALILCLILSCGVLFSSCKKDEETKSSQVEEITTTTTVKEDVKEVETVIEENTDETIKETNETHTVYVDVTDKEGKSKTSKVEYSVMGGSDPYVEDIF